MQAVDQVTNGKPTHYKLVPCPDCAPETQEDRRRLAGILTPKTFAEWRVNPVMDQALAACKELLAGQRWVVFLRGGTGIGKTHLALATADQALEDGQRVMFVNVPDFLARLKETFDGSQSFAGVFDTYANAEMLVLDDLGAEYRTHWALSELYRVIDRRYRAQAALLVTSNERSDNEIDARVLSRLRPGEVYVRGANDRRREFEQ